MRIESVFSSLPAPQPSGEGVRRPAPPYPEFSLTSSHAPTWPASVGRMFSFLWEKLCAFFSFIFRRKKTATPPPPPPALDVIRTIQMERMKEEQKPSAGKYLKSLAGQAFLPGAFALYQGKFHEFIPTFASNVLIQISSTGIEKTARYTFSTCSLPLAKGLGQLIAVPVISYGASSLGYPRGWFPNIFATIGIAMSFFQAYNEHLAKQEQELFARVAAR